MEKKIGNKIGSYDSFINEEFNVWQKDDSWEQDLYNAIKNPHAKKYTESEMSDCLVKINSFVKSKSGPNFTITDSTTKERRNFNGFKFFIKVLKKDGFYGYIWVGGYDETNQKFYASPGLKTQKPEIKNLKGRDSFLYGDAKVFKLNESDYSRLYKFLTSDRASDGVRWDKYFSTNFNVIEKG